MKYIIVTALLFATCVNAGPSLLTASKLRSLSVKASNCEYYENYYNNHGLNQGYDYFIVNGRIKVRSVHGEMSASTWRENMWANYVHDASCQTDARNRIADIIRNPSRQFLRECVSPSKRGLISKLTEQAVRAAQSHLGRLVSLQERYRNMGARLRSLRLELASMRSHMQHQLAKGNVTYSVQAEHTVARNKLLAEINDIRKIIRNIEVEFKDTLRTSIAEINQDQKNIFNKIWSSDKSILSRDVQNIKGTPRSGYGNSPTWDWDYTR